MGEVVKQILTRPIHLTDQVIKIADKSVQFRNECLDVQSKTKRLASLIWEVALVTSDLYERPVRRIVNAMEQALEKALSLVDKCSPHCIWVRLFRVITRCSFRKTLHQLDNSIGDMTWLQRLSSANNKNDPGLPPIASNEPLLCEIWQEIAHLSSVSLEDRSEAVAFLLSVARENNHHRYGKLIIGEGGLEPLLKLVEEGNQEDQEKACRTIAFLGCDPDSVEMILEAGVGPIFNKILEKGHQQNIGIVAWAVSELAANHAKFQDDFAQNNVIPLIRMFVSYLEYGTISEHTRYIRR